MTKRTRLVSSGVILALCLMLGTAFHRANARGNQVYESFELFTGVYQILQSYYYDRDKLKSRDLIYGAIKGMMQSLDDEHSSFLDPEELKSLSEDTSGEFGGLGIMIGIRDKKLTVISPIFGTPAWEKQIRPGDVISRIDGKPTKDLTLNEAVRRLRGRVGSTVKVTIIRAGNEEAVDIELVRAVIKIETVKERYIEDLGIGYVRITQFSHNTAEMLKKTLSGFAKQRGLKALILDLRNNPGGLLSASIEVSDIFLSGGLIVYTKGRDEEQTKPFFAERSSDDFPERIPIIVMVNKGSASASEIVAGALKDTGRAILLGEKTFGKGSVQTIRMLGDGSAVKLTIALYFTPGGHQIHNKGLEPDKLVEIPEYSLKEQRDIFDLVNGTQLSDFLKAHPKPEAKDIDALVEELRGKGVTLSRFEIERWIAWEQNKIGEPELVDLKFDLQLKRAVEMIKAGEIKAGSVRQFQETR